jgi:hypothetical protein
MEQVRAEEGTCRELAVDLGEADPALFHFEVAVALV